MEYNKNKRPIYLNLLKIRLPIGGVVSILHRITGIILVLSLPVAIYLLQLSLHSPSGFDQVSAWLSSLPLQLLLLLFLWMFIQHFFSGVRHLLLDLDIGISKAASRTTAWLTLLITVVVLIIIGGWWQ